KHRPTSGFALQVDSLVFPSLFRDTVQDSDPIVAFLLSFSPLTDGQGSPGVFSLSAGQHLTSRSYSLSKYEQTEAQVEHYWTKVTQKSRRTSEV
ncbi:hypothetical protein STEG23_010662, partial [Scotinomys teguina]